MVQPLPTVSPDKAFDANGNPFGFRPSVATPSTSYGMTAQLGVYYDMTEQISIGASFYPRQVFDVYHWESEYTNPSNPATYWDL